MGFQLPQADDGTHRLGVIAIGLGLGVDILDVVGERADLLVFHPGGRDEHAGDEPGGYRADGERGGGQWNRGWRADRRYDWSGYRRGHDELFRLPRYSAPYGWNYGYQRFGIGVVIDEGLFAPDYWIDDPYEYRLPPVDGPYRWVRYYGDALLVDIYTGEVVDTVYGIFG